MIFPVELMYNHISDKEALNKLETPYVYINDEGFIPKSCSIYSLLVEAGAIKTELKSSSVDFNTVARGLRHSMMKAVLMMPTMLMEYVMVNW